MGKKFVCISEVNCIASLRKTIKTFNGGQKPFLGVNDLNFGERRLRRTVSVGRGNRFEKVNVCTTKMVGGGGREGQCLHHQDGVEGVK